MNLITYNEDIMTPHIRTITIGVPVEAREQKHAADRLRQRKCRARKSDHVATLQAEIETLRSRLRHVEAERDELRATVDNVSTLLDRRSSPEEEQVYRPEDVEMVQLPPIRRFCSPPRRPEQQYSSEGRGYMPPWLLVPRNTPPTCPLDMMLSELENIGCRFESRNLRVPELETNATPLFASLGDANTIIPTLKGDSIISSILVGHVSLALSIDRLPGRLAALWSLFYVVRWRICQSKEAFSAMPDFFAPTVVQIRVPHPHWIDTLPWPAARDAVIQHLDHSQYPRFRKMLNETFIIRWDEDVSNCLRKADDGDFTLSDAFHQHLQHLENWGVRHAAVAEFPFLEGLVNVIEDSYT